MKFLFAIILVPFVLQACVETPDNNRYPGTIPPCDVRVDEADERDTMLERTSGLDFDPPRLWLPGPYPVWNTSPETTCSVDPTIPEVGDEVNVRMYITYPAASEPTISGNGRVADGSFPVIIFAHANNDRTCEIYRSYFALHDHWASWGFIVVSVDGTALNCQRGNRTNVELRSEGQLRAIDALRALNADPESRFHERLDMDSIFFAGHSRGGAASLVSAQEYDQAIGVITLQGVDLTAFGFGTAILPPFPVLGVTAGEDTDVPYPNVETNEDQLGGPYAWVNMNGAIHGYTSAGPPMQPNTEPLISRAKQHQIQQLFTTAFLAHYAGGALDRGNQRDLLASHRHIFSLEGTRLVHEHISDLGAFVRWNRMVDAIMVDDFQSNRPDDQPLLEGAYSSEGLTINQNVPTYRPDERHLSGRWGNSWARHLATDDQGRWNIGFDEDQAPVIPAGYHLMARVKGPDEGATSRFSVEVVTASGTTRFDEDAFGWAVPLENRFHQLALDLGFTEPTEVLEINFELEAGEIFVDDLRFALP